MGCVSSSNQDRQCFQVSNVDEKGNTVASGRLQVSNTDLIFFQRGKHPILWPLRCLRRYGFDSELFSFECGRRCPTGAGIYAFKCKQAESLFNILQATVKKNSSQDTGGLPLDEPETTDSQRENGVLGSVSEGNAPLRYVNEDAGTVVQVHSANCLGHRFSNSSIRDCDCGVVADRFYENIGATGGQATSSNLVRTSSLRQRSNTLPSLTHSKTLPSEIKEQMYMNVDSTSHPISPFTESLEPTQPSPREGHEDIKYIELEMGPTTPSPGIQSPTSHPSSTPGASSEGYATIDFDKTAALSTSIQDHRTSRPVPS